VTLSRTSFCVVSPRKRKRKEKKRNINNDLAVLPSHDKLPKSIRIHSVVNVSRVRLYKPQVEGQKKIPPKPVIIKEEEEFEVEKILNKRTIRGKEKFLVR